MEIILLVIYSFFVWLIFFKMKWLPWNITSQVIVVTIPIIALTIHHSVHEYRRALVARRAGDELRHPDRAARDRAGDRGADRTEPADQERRRAFQDRPGAFRGGGEGRRGHAAAGLKDQLKNATAKKAALTPRIDLAKKRVEQFTALAATGAGKRADLEQAQSDLGNLESEYLAADATESQVQKAQIVKCRSRS